MSDAPPPSPPWYRSVTVAATGRGRAAGMLVVLLGALALWWVGYQRSFQSLAYPDACDYAQLGRQLARGEGFSSQQTFPYVLVWLDQHAQDLRPPWPNVTRFPLPTLVRGALFALAGASDLVALLPNLAYFAATALLVFLLANRLGGAWAGLAAALLYVTSRTQLHYALSGLSETGAGFFIVALAYGAVTLPRERGTLRCAAALGALVGLAWLQRANLIVLAIAWAAVAWLGPNRLGFKRGAGVLGIGAGVALAVVSPWLLRNWIQLGSPLVSLTADRFVAIGLADRDPFYRFVQIEPFALMLEHLDVIGRRLTGVWLLDHWQALFGREYRFLGPLFVLSLGLKMPRPARALAVFAGVALLAMYLAFTVVHSVERYYHPFAPLVLASTCVAIAHLVARVRPVLWPWTLGAAAVVALLLSARCFTRLDEVALERTAAQVRLDTVTRELVPAGAVVASDRSWDVAWHADRFGVRLLGGASRLAQLELGLRVDAVVLSRPHARHLRRGLATHGLSERFVEAYRAPDGTTIWLRRGPRDREAAPR